MCRSTTHGRLTPAGVCDGPGDVQAKKAPRREGPTRGRTARLGWGARISAPSSRNLVGASLFRTNSKFFSENFCGGLRRDASSDEAWFSFAKSGKFSQRLRHGSEAPQAGLIRPSENAAPCCRARSGPGRLFARPPPRNKSRRPQVRSRRPGGGDFRCLAALRAVRNCPVILFLPRASLRRCRATVPDV